MNEKTIFDDAATDCRADEPTEAGFQFVWIDEKDSMES